MGRFFACGLSIDHAVAMLTELAEHLRDALSTWMLHVQVDERPDDFGDAVWLPTQKVGVLLEWGLAPAPRQRPLPAQCRAGQGPWCSRQWRDIVA